MIIRPKVEPDALICEPTRLPHASPDPSRPSASVRTSFLDLTERISADAAKLHAIGTRDLDDRDVSELVRRDGRAMDDLDAVQVFE